MSPRAFIPCSVGRPLAAIFLATTVGALRAQTESGAAPVPGGYYDIPPTVEHPRNSEGAFVALKSGQIAFYYSQFSGGYGDDSASDIAEIHSHDIGVTWSAPRPVIPRGSNQNVMSVSLLHLANGKLAMFYCPTENDTSSRPCLTLSEDEGATWMPPSQIIAAAGWYVVNNDRVIQTRTGRIIVPAAFSRVRRPLLPTDRNFDAAPAITLWCLSDDNGFTWREAETEWGLPVRSKRVFPPVGLEEPGVVELADGSLFSWSRTDQGEQWGFRSTDDGESWTPPQPTELKSPTSPASIKRLPNSSWLLAILNDHSGRFPQGVGQHRTPLTAAISKDGGRTWPIRNPIETDPEGNYAYCAIQFAGDTVLLAYIAVDGPNNHPGPGTPDAPAHQVGFGTRIRRIPLAWLLAQH